MCDIPKFNQSRWHFESWTAEIQVPRFIDLWTSESEVPALVSELKEPDPEFQKWCPWLEVGMGGNKASKLVDKVEKMNLNGGGAGMEDQPDGCFPRLAQVLEDGRSMY